MSRWVAAIGENPLRVLRLASHARPAQIVVISTPETRYVVPEIRTALGELDVDTEVKEVAGDAYRWDVTAAAIAAAIQGAARDYHWLIAGGTKPMIAAQVSVGADVPAEQFWSLDDRAGILQAWTGEQARIEPPARNLSVSTMARLHAGMGVELDDNFAAPTSSGSVARQSIATWAKALGRSSRAQDVAQRIAVNRNAEAGFVALVRAMLPSKYGVYGSTTVILRDPVDPSVPARDPFRSGDASTGDYAPRTFELDGVVIRGLQPWVLEFKNAKIPPLGVRTHAAELDIRRRHFGGDGAIGVLATTTRAPEDGDAADVVSPLVPLEFELGRTLHVDLPLLKEAAQCWLNGMGDASRLAAVIR